MHQLNEWTTVGEGKRPLKRLTLYRRCDDPAERRAHPAESRPAAALLPDIAALRFYTWRLEQLAASVQKLADRLTTLENAGQVVPLTSFAPEPYVVKRNIPILIQPQGGEFGASFFDANIHAAGETEQEAFENIRGLILDFYEQLRDAPPTSLGPEMARCLAVLREFVDG